MARPRQRVTGKPLVLMADEIKTPPFSEEARIEAGTFLRQVQHGATLPMPFSRPMPSIGPGCHELRIRDKAGEWRILYQVRAHEILVARIFKKKTAKTPRQEIDLARRRIAAHDRATLGPEKSPESER